MEPISVNNLLKYVVRNEVLMFSCVEGGSAPADRDGDTANGDEAALFFHVNIIMSTRLDKKPTTALFWQQTGLALQEFPPTPMTEMGEQPKPTRAVISVRTIPSKPRSAEIGSELA